MGAFVVDDFENGPRAREAETNACMVPQFNGFAPAVDGGAVQCDYPGWSPSSCKGVPFCDGTYGGVCPVYIGRDECAWRGTYSLRLYYNIDKNGGAFAGTTFNLSNKQNPSDTCQVNREPVDLTNFDYLSLRVRPGDAKGNAEVAIQDMHSTSSNLVETNPKAVLVSSPVNSNRYIPPLTGTMLPQGQWTEVQIKVCDLLKRTTGDGGVAQLDRKAITKVFIDFAKNRFITEGTDLFGTRQLDIDDIVFLPCAMTGCLPCP
jgi:hypothetical protein